MKSKIITADDKLRQLFAVVDDHGHTVIQVTSLDRARAVLRLLGVLH